MGGVQRQPRRVRQGVARVRRAGREHDDDADADAGARMERIAVAAAGGRVDAVLAASGMNARGNVERARGTRVAARGSLAS